MTKSNPGNFFEDFSVGQVLKHATPRTLTEADAALNIALTGSRYALFSADSFAQECGLGQAPIDPLLVFHVVFGKSVPDVSLNAVANLGYAEGRFLAPVYPGDTLSATSEVIGLKENSNGETGIVTVRTRGENQLGEEVLSFARWVMVNKKDRASPAPEPIPAKLAGAVGPGELILPPELSFGAYDWDRAGAPHAFEDYEIGEKIDHVDGVTIEEAEHQLATRLYQNTAKVHFDALAQKDSRFGQRLVYGGVAISLARALAFNGLANAGLMLAINAGRHVAPLFAGDTLYAWSEVLASADLGEAGALRLRLVALKNRPAAGFPYKNAAGEYEPEVILDFDYWAAIPKRP
ncbi:MAG: MaoC family dehydratase [Terricaulis sp.]